MKFPLMKFLAALGALSLGAGCGHVDVSPEANRSRVLAGTVNVGQALPAGSEILVRIVVPVGGNMTVKTGSDIPVVRPNLTGGEQILGEFVQTLAAPAGEAVPFKIEFNAEDAVLRRGVNLEARVYFNGRVRFRTVNAHAVTVNSAHFPQTLFLQAVAR